jgi:hypothetical protein
MYVYNKISIKFRKKDAIREMRSMEDKIKFNSRVKPHILKFSESVWLLLYKNGSEIV